MPPPGHRPAEDGENLVDREFFGSKSANKKALLRGEDPRVRGQVDLGTLISVAHREPDKAVRLADDPYLQPGTAQRLLDERADTIHGLRGEPEEVQVLGQTVHVSAADQRPPPANAKSSPSIVRPARRAMRCCRGLSIRVGGAVPLEPCRPGPPDPWRQDEAVPQTKELVWVEVETDIVIVGFAVGMRPGELAGLLWSDLDLDLDASPPTLPVSGSMKWTDGEKVIGRGDVKRSTAGRRTLALPQEALEAPRAQQVLQDAERDTAGVDWEEQGLVFPSSRGTPLNPNDLHRDFRRFGKSAGVEGSMPYMMRHTAATLTIDRGAGIDTGRRRAR